MWLGILLASRRLSRKAGCPGPGMDSRTIPPPHPASGNPVGSNSWPALALTPWDSSNLEKCRRPASKNFYQQVVDTAPTPALQPLQAPAQPPTLLPMDPGRPTLGPPWPALASQGPQPSNSTECRRPATSNNPLYQQVVDPTPTPPTRTLRTPPPRPSTTTDDSKDSKGPRGPPIWLIVARSTLPAPPIPPSQPRCRALPGDLVS